MSLRAIRIILVALLALAVALLIFGPQAKDHLPQIGEAIAAKEKPSWWDDAAIGVHDAAWFQVIVLVGLIATSGIWTRGFTSSKIQGETANMMTPGWFWPLLIVAATLCLGLRLPLASKSLWWDEAWVIMQASHGKWTPDKKHEGQMKFTAHDWKRCAWYYQKPTNHAPMSLMQKLSIGAWQKITGAKRSEFSDLAAHVPALMASCIAVVLLGLLLRAWGKPGAGVCAAFILAIHPWHIRYGVDARAYALVVPLCISGMLAITRIYESGVRKILPLVLWGATEFLWLWAFPNAVFDIAGLNIVAAVLLWKYYDGDKCDRWTALMRLMVTNVFAAMCFIQMFLPNLMQARRWAGQESDAHVLDWHLTGETFAQILFGMPVASVSMTLVAAGGLAGFCMLFVILFRVRSRSHGAVHILLVLLTSAVLFATVTKLAGSYFYPRFVVAVLPVAIAAGCFVSGTKSLTAVLIYAYGLAGPVAHILKLPYAPLHDVGSFISAFAAEKNTLTACYGHGSEVMSVYSPSILQLQTRAELEELIKQAKREHRDLFVTYGHPGFNRTMHSEGFTLLDDSSIFEEVRSFAGIESEFFYRVLRMK